MSPMTRCNCGEKIPLDAPNFCRHCGVALRGRCALCKKRLDAEDRLAMALARIAHLEAELAQGAS